MKVCRRCGEEKPKSCFSKNRGGAQGLHSRCKDCRKAARDPATTYERNAKYQRENAQRCRQWNKDYRARLRLAVLSAYGGETPSCQCCGESRLGFLAIDHIDGNGNEHRREIGGGSRLYTWIKKNGYPPGFRVLCFNCNSAIALYGICPHVDPRAGSLGQEVDKQPSREYLCAATAAVVAVALKEGR